MKTPRDELFTSNERERQELRRKRRWFLIVGATLVAIGIAGMVWVLTR